MGKPTYWHLKPSITVATSIFPKRGFYGNDSVLGFPEFQATSLHVFNHFETTRHDKIINYPIQESKITILNVTIEKKNYTWT